MENFNLFDRVKAAKQILEVPEGTPGTVVYLYENNPNICEVEFVIAGHNIVHSVRKKQIIKDSL